jgi:glycosyltransferase involved in cell wall biosynthesis
VPLKPKLTLGQLRNISIEHATGEYFCQWDDDDWYHMDRLSAQWQQVHTMGQQASVLTYYLMVDALRQRCYFSKFRLWEGSILCTRNIYPQVKYPAEKKSEDSIFLYQLIRKYQIVPMYQPNLYVYIYHGNNTWHQEHFQKIFHNSQLLSAQATKIVLRAVSGRVSVKAASHLLNDTALLQELNFLYANKQFLVNQDTVKSSLT